MDVDFLKTRARFNSHQVVICDPLKGKEWTYKDLNERAINLAHYLLAYGISKGDRVALFSPNDIAYFDLLFACTKIGAILVPINWRLKPIEIKKYLKIVSQR